MQLVNRFACNVRGTAQTSKMEIFAKIVNFFAKLSILIVSVGLGTSTSLNLSLV